MAGLSVWAPHAKRVELEWEAGTGPAGKPTARSLARGEHGHFYLPDPALPPGARYRLRLDGGPALPDPRSGFQPEGVHGPSLVVDHAAFSWTDTGF